MKLRGRTIIHIKSASVFPAAEQKLIIQKFTSISPSSEYLAVGTTDDKVSLLRLSSLDVAVGSFEVEGELVDLDWGGVDGELVRELHLVRGVGPVLMGSWR